jgi:hypothetical protein
MATVGWTSTSCNHSGGQAAAVLIRLGDGQVRIRRGRQNRLVLPRPRRNWTQSEIVEQRILADDLTAILSGLTTVTLEEEFRLAN